ncbi:MAG: TolC family protein [Kiritimatiellae bacterium]|nr:TolC family protein [Kiritimatiellia bacterium]
MWKKARAAALAALWAGVAGASGEGPLAFRDGVAQALAHSPYLEAGGIEVSMRELDEADARSEYVPRFSLRTRYYVDPPAGSDERLYLSFAVDPYNPVEAHLSLRAQKLLTRLAVLAHLQTIADGLRRVGAGWLEVEALGRLEGLESELLSLAEAGVATASNRVAAGTRPEPEWRAAEREVEIRRLQLDHTRRTRAEVLEGLAALIGWPEDRAFSVEAASAAAQVLGDPPDPGAAWETVRDRSIESEARDLQRQLQELRILAARAAYIPDLWLGVSTPDPLSGADDGDFYFSVGVDIPIWDGWKRAREIARQKAALLQQDRSGRLEVLDLRARWRAAESACRATELDWLAAQAAAEKADQAERQAAAGDAARRARAEWLDAERRALRAELIYHKACLERDALSGALLDRLCQTETEQP